MSDIATTMSRGGRRLPALLPSSQGAVLVLLLLFVAALSLAPLVRLAVTGIAPAGFIDLDRLADLLLKRRVVTATLNSLQVAALSTVIAVALGTLAALLTALTDMRARTAWVFGFVLPLMIPPQVTALAWVQAFSPTSPVLGALGLALEPGARHPLFSATGIIVLLGLTNAPLVFLTVRASLARLPASLAEAARAAGAGNLRLVATIVLPLARAGLLAGAGLAFVSAIGNFGIQAMLGIPARFPTLVTLIYRQMNAYGPSALSDMATLALLLSTVTVAALAFAGWAGRRGNLQVDGSGGTIRIPLGRARPMVEAGAWAFLVATLALPLSALVATSLVSGYGQGLTFETLTFEHYVNALFRHSQIREAFATSFTLTGAAVAILLVVSLFLGWFLTFRRGPEVRAAHMAAELAYALPGVILGVAMILFFLRPLPLLGFSLYGTPWIILAAYLSNFLALALRPILGGFAQVDRSLEEAARVAGAGFLTRMRDIIAPLVAPSLFASGILVFMTVLNEIQVSILLVSSSTRTIGPMIVFLDEAGSSTLAAAVGCLMVLVVFALMLAASLASRRLPKGALPWQD
ncbi:MAG: ABC transporter permease [Stappia sp.]|uniref:ABC transporter permease n=1 Tax=Stappia sp. TaxID=1870903 RepID=UPI000C4874F0|nr:iron ABC transporter permease [Stappia sp.]MAA98460.1 ABC transporter permease [Stappia sp.]MBM19124.1 ABC transporter permease [Stappia sp.]MBM20196.1 ABC transporter permease [Stappia sp.]